MKYLILGQQDGVMRVRDDAPPSPDIKYVEVSDEVGALAQTLLDERKNPIWIDSTVLSRRDLIAEGKRVQWNEELNKLVIIEPPVRPTPAAPEAPALTPLQILADNGVEVEEGVVLGASTPDKEQWTALQVHLDGKQEQASKDSGFTWEQVRPTFNSQPITVMRKDGTPWTTTIGAVREAIVKVGDAYLAAWLASK